MNGLFPASTLSGPLRNARVGVLLTLAALSALAWAALAWQMLSMSSAGMAPAGMAPDAMDASTSMAMGSGMGSTAGDGLTAALMGGMSAPLFLAIWAVMMAAMMLPSAAPMILVFDAVRAGRAARNQPAASTAVFTSAYLAIWIAAGFVALAAAFAAGRLLDAWPDLAAIGPRIGGAALLAAGIYQLTPLKEACLSQCRTPTQMLMTSWREGRAGAFRMGLIHGAWCFGCCWLLFVVLFPLGVMNLAVMAGVSLLVLAEKTLPVASWASRAIGLLLIAGGIVVLVRPEMLPPLA